MSTEDKRDDNRPELPKLDADPDMFQWVMCAMALNMPMAAAAEAFLDAFPNFDKGNDYSQKELIDTLISRFSNLKYDSRRPPYSQIKQKKEFLQKFLDCLPVTSPLVRLTDLEVLRQQCRREMKSDPIKYGHLLVKLQTAALKEMNTLQPPDKRSGAFPLPSGPAPWEQKDKDKVDTSQKGGDPFGGAIMNITEGHEDVDSE